MGSSRAVSGWPLHSCALWPHIIVGVSKGLSLLLRAGPVPGAAQGLAHQIKLRKASLPPSFSLYLCMETHHAGHFHSWARRHTGYTDSGPHACCRPCSPALCQHTPLTPHSRVHHSCCTRTLPAHTPPMHIPLTCCLSCTPLPTGHSRALPAHTPPRQLLTPSGSGTPSGHTRSHTQASQDSDAPAHSAHPACPVLWPPFRHARSCAVSHSCTCASSLYTLTCVHPPAPGPPGGMNACTRHPQAHVCTPTSAPFPYVRICVYSYPHSTTHSHVAIRP